MTDTPGLIVPVEVGTKKLGSSIDKAVNKVERGMSKIAQEFIKNNPGSHLAKMAKENADLADKEFRRHERSITRLKTSLDPAYAAQRRYERAARQVAEAVRMGAVSQKDANAILELARARHLGAAGAAQTHAAAQRGMFNVSNAGRFVIQNTANQVGDMAVQLQMGTSPMRVMAQQLPQVFGGFSALGGALGLVAPLLGTIAAIGFPVAAFLLATGDDAEEAADKVETFAEALSSAKTAIDRASTAMRLAGAGGAEDLAEVYGAVTDKVRDLASALAEIEIRAAEVELNQVLDQALGEEFLQQIDGAFDRVTGSLLTAGSDRALAEVETLQGMIDLVKTELASLDLDDDFTRPAMEAELVRLNEELALAEGRIQDIGSLASELSLPPDVLSTWAELQERLDDARDADQFAVVASVLSDMRAILESMGDEIDQGVKDQLALAEGQAREMATALSNARNIGQQLGGVDMSGGMHAATSAAVELARQLGISLSIAQRLAGAVGSSEIVLDPRDPRYDPENARLARIATEMGAISNEYGTVSPFVPSRETEPETRRRGGGRRSGGRSRGREEFDLFANIEREMTALERQIEMVGKSRREIVALTAKYELLDEARERGIDLNQRSTETGRTLREEINAQAEAIANLTIEAEQYAAQADFMADLNQDLKDGLIDAIIEGKNFGEVLENVAKQLAKAALQAALFGDGPLAGLFGGGGFLGGLFGGGGLKFFARGTNYAPGGAAIVGEEGPELVHLPRGSKVIPNHKLGQGGGRSQVDVFVHPSGEFDTRVQQISGDVAVNVSGQMISENNRQVSQMQRR